MKNILVPTDFSDEANNALNLAHIVASKLGADINLLHVVEAPGASSFKVTGETDVSSSMDDVYVGMVVGKAKESFEEIASSSKYEGVNINYDIKVGNTFNTIFQKVAELGCQMIVMGTQGSSGLDEIFIGSNTEKVVRTAGCPVLSLKTEADESVFNDIVFATDMGENQGGMVSQLKEFQSAFNSTLHIVKVNTPNTFQSDRITKAQMRKFVEMHSIENCTTNIFNDTLEGDGIMYFAQDINAGMIAMATHGRTGLSHLFSGSIAEDIVNHAKRPVLTFNINK